MHLKLKDKFQAQSFASYLSNASRCAKANTPEVFLEFSNLMQAFEPDVRNQCIKALNKALQDNNTPIQYLAYFALSATDPVKDNVNTAERFLKENIGFRRELIKQITKAKMASPESLSAINPASALPYLIYILSHHSEFSQDDKNLSSFAIYLRFFMKPLCAGITNFDEIQEILIQMKYAEDKDDEYTPNMVKLCQVAVTIIMEIGGGRVWEPPSQPVKIYLPSRYFSPCTDQDRIRRDIIQSTMDIIKSPAKPKKILNAGMSPARPSRIKRTGKQARKNVKDESEDSESEQEIIETPKRKSSTSTPKRGRKQKEESDSESESEESEKASTPKRKSSTSTPKRKTSNAQKGKKEEESKTPKRGKRSATPKKASKDEESEPEETKETPKRGKRAATPKKGKQEKEEEKTETPKRGRKPAEKKADSKKEPAKRGKKVEEKKETPKKSSRSATPKKSSRAATPKKK